MSDPNSEFQTPPPPPAPVSPPVGPRPTKLRPIAIGLFVVGLIALVAGIAKILPPSDLIGVLANCGEGPVT